MARRTPYVADGVLHVREPSGRPEIAVDSPSWVGTASCAPNLA